MKVIVAVDGGGSRCRLGAFDEQGDVLARFVVDEHASLSLGVSAAWQHIELGLHGLRRQMKKDASWQPDHLMMGLAGSLQQRRRHDFLKLVTRGVSCDLVTDGHAQLMGASNGEPGICLAIGTGSVVHWWDAQGNGGMAGGWGFPAGDQGSGAWLGLRLMQHYIRYRDGDKSSSSLIAATEQRIGTSVSSIQQWTTESRSSVLAQLAPLVFEHAANGDALAVDLLQEAIDHCMTLIMYAPADLPVYIVGGVGEQLTTQLRDHLGSRIRKSQGDALRGLWQIWRAAYRTV